MSGGHVFVVQGLVEHLDCDAVVLPSDERFVLEPDWDAVLGRPARRPGPGAPDAARSHDDPLRPHDWAGRRYGRAAADAPAPPPRPTWFIDAVWREDSDAEHAARDLAERLAATLREIAEAAIEPGHQRPHPLVAVPALGTGGGGFDRVRGLLIDRLLQACQDAVEGASLDVAVVAKHPADYSAFQEVRRRRPDGERQVTAELAETARSLAGLAARGQLALFLGAGVGVAAGLPSWRQLLTGLRSRTDVPVDDLSPLDQAELLRRELGESFGEQVAAELRGAERYALTHAALAALGCTEVVTTNYDTLYELAAGDVAGHAVPVLPGEAVRPGEPWVLKMHGDVARPSSIVLSRSDLVAYDATARPMGSMVQALMITRHLLVVGTSMTDDNFLRLAHEVAAFQDRDAAARPPVAGRTDVPARERDTGRAAPATADDATLIGTVVTLSPKPAQERLWRGRFRYVATSTDVDGEPERARRLAIFLDLVAMLAASRDRYLLDPRYERMLGSDAERRAAQTARELARAVDELPDGAAAPWRALRGRLHELGGGER